VSKGWFGRRRAVTDPPAAAGQEDHAGRAHPAEHERDRLAHIVSRVSVGIVVFAADRTEAFRNPAANSFAGGHAAVLVDEAVQRAAAAALVDGAHEDAVDFFGPPRAVLRVRGEALPTGGAMVTIEDVSERARAETVRTDLVANMSHELKTPVGALAILAETIADVDDPEVVQRLSKRMVDEAHRMARTIDELLELSRVELDGQLPAQPVAVSTVLDDVVQRTGIMAEQHGVRLVVVADDAAAVTGSHLQLVSAVSNLVENAIVYSEPDQEVVVRVASDTDSVRIVVSDHGPGIPLREQDRIFERFYRVDRARSRASGGTGIGLAIVRNVAVHHGGSVSVSSREGEGAVFTLTLPVRVDRS
jgi:two-component system sensor histidine kinase SenX3